jgi:hypothetical protein
MTAATSTKATVEAVEENGSKAGSALLTGLRKAAKAAGKATGAADRTAASTEAVKYLSGARGIYGDPKAAADAVVKAEDMHREADALQEQYGQPFAQWVKIAALSKESGVTSRGWAEATGSSAMMLGRLVGTHNLYTAARENGTPITLGQAYNLANTLTRTAVDERVAAYVAAENGTDPTTGESAATEPKVPTVESYLKGLERLGESLSTLLSGDFKTPKADTLEAMLKAEQTLTRISKQHATLIGQVRKAGKSPKGKAVA